MTTLKRMIQDMPADPLRIVHEMVGPSEIRPPNPYRGSGRYRHRTKTASPEPKLTRKTADKYEPLVNQMDINLRMQELRAIKADKAKQQFIADSYIGRDRTYAEQIDYLNQIRRIGRDSEKYYDLVRKGQTDTPVIKEETMRTAPVAKLTQGSLVHDSGKRSARRKLDFDEPPVKDIEDVVKDKKRGPKPTMFRPRKVPTQ